MDKPLSVILSRTNTFDIVQHLSNYILMEDYSHNSTWYVSSRLNTIWYNTTDNIRPSDNFNIVYKRT